MKKEGGRSGEGRSSSSKQADYYKILQVDRKAKDDDLKKAYHKLKKGFEAAVFQRSSWFGHQIYGSAAAPSSWFGDDVFGSAADVVREKNALPIKKKLACSLEELYTGTTQEIGDTSGFQAIPRSAPYMTSTARRYSREAFRVPLSRSVLSSRFRDDVFGSAADGVREKKAQPIKRRLSCTLEELYTGTTKEMKISREIADISGKMMPMEDILMININAGLKNGTRIPYPKKEDDVIPADIVFVVEEMPHEIFTRKGNNLITTQKISLVQALKAYTAHLKMLDGRTLTIPISSISSIIHLRYGKVVPGEGMPIAEDPSKRSKLKIRFKIKIPNIS